jgi:hypothetical protein
MIKILAVSDLEYLADNKVELEDIDLLINCGDLRPGYLEYLIHRYRPKKSVMTYGNHDKAYEDSSLQPDEFSQVYRGFNILTNNFLDIDDLNIRIGGFSGARARGESPFYYTKSDAKKFYKKLHLINYFSNMLGLKNKETDIFISHHPPNIDNLIPDIGQYHKPCNQLGKIFNLLKPKIWFYGHIEPRYTNEQLDFKYQGSNIINCSPYKYVEIENGEVRVNGAL